ncbi:MAG: hypothetical protein ACP5H2_12115 [Solirubrobacteraceae bacterium]
MALTTGLKLYTEPGGEISQPDIEVTGSQLAANNLKSDSLYGQRNYITPPNGS